MFDLSGEVALVTGGNRGIGRGIALGLAGVGADVAIMGRDEKRNERTRAEVEALALRSLAVQVDLTDRAALDREGHDGRRARDRVERRDPDANPGGALGPARGPRRNRRIPCLPRI